MKLDKNWLEKKWVGYGLALCSAVLFYVLLTHFGVFLGGLLTFIGYFTPVIMGLIFAYVINPLRALFYDKIFGRMRRERTKKYLSVVLSLTVLLVFIVVLLVALIPQIFDSIISFVSNIDTYARTLQRLLHRLSDYAMRFDIDISSFTEMGGDLLNNITKTLPASVNRILNTSYSIGVGVFNGVISFILAIYFLVDKDRFLSGTRRLMKALLPVHRYEQTMEFLSRCHAILIRFIICDLLDGLIIGIINLIFQTIMKMPYAVLISTVVGVTNLAPTFGPIFGAILGAFILVLFNPWQALWFLLFTIALQTLDGYFIKPRLFGGVMGVPSVWILICIIVGGRMFGVPGILLSIPFAAISDYMYGQWIIGKERKQQENIQT